jgi:hypothetical protein
VKLGNTKRLKEPLDVLVISLEALSHRDQRIDSTPDQVESLNNSFASFRDVDDLLHSVGTILLEKLARAFGHEGRQPSSFCHLVVANG